MPFTSGMGISLGSPYHRAEILQQPRKHVAMVCIFDRAAAQFRNREEKCLGPRFRDKADTGGN